jgi:hypothetical protein
MKNMKKYILHTISAAAMMLALVSCDDFLDRTPTNSIAASEYFKTEKDLKMYCNGLIESYLPSFTSVAIGSDANTDFCATKSSSDFYHPGIWNAEKQTGWSSGNWSFIRSTNYMLENMTRAKGNVSTEVYNHYEGVARFWRAYGHWIKICTFGNIPWLDHVLEKDDSILYMPRMDREYVFHMLLQDLDFAGENCLATSEYLTSGRTYVNKWVVLAYKARVCLQEASYRKYHSVNPSTNVSWNNNYETSDELYKEAADACEEIINSGVFSLHNTGNPESDYSELFTSMVIPTDEVIWSRQASDGEANVLHSVTWYYRSSSMGQQYSPTKELVDMYLTLDGTPITSDMVSPDEEFTNRDWRLAQSIVGPGYTYQTLSGTDSTYTVNFTQCWTGYQFHKWCVEKEENYSRALSNNSVPILRYGEVLLNYAEAKAELGEMTEDIWNETIGALRERAGVTNIYPESADYVEDSFLNSYYNDGVNSETLSNIILEIRRERAVELVMEDGLRNDDLMRWNEGYKIAERYNNQGWRGIYLTADQVSNGFTINGIAHTVSFKKAGNATNYLISNTGADNTWSLTEGTYGYLVYNYALEWDDKMYVNPIPATALSENPNLGQNYGW